MTRHILIDTVPLFPVLDKLLTELLRSLTPEEWQSPTIAKLWRVKDIAAHLLDVSLRTLSVSRDNYSGGQPENIQSYEDLVAYLNQLNADWVKASQRLSPQVITDLLESVGQEHAAHLATLDPFAPAVFSVAWAGEETSQNWFHIAREYTEKWIHQQQIRDAVGKPALMTRQLFYPFIDTFMRGLPHAYRHIHAPEGTIVSLTVTTDIGGDWYLKRTADNWQLSKTHSGEPAAHLLIDPDTAWRLFSKGITPETAKQMVTITGDAALGETALHMVSVMA